MRTLAALALAATLTGCASLPPAATSRETFAACQIADAATTYYALSHRVGFVEGNPIMAKLMSHGWLPFLGFKAFLVWYVYWLDASPPVQTTFNAIACAPVIHNVHVLR